LLIATSYSLASNDLAYTVFRHLRFLLKCAEELTNKKPTLAELQNQATTSAAVTGAIQSDLSVIKENQLIDHATIQEEKDGHTNEKYV
jgi:hypothetical protein